MPTHLITLYGQIWILTMKPFYVLQVLQKFGFAGLRVGSIIDGGVVARCCEYHFETIEYVVSRGICYNYFFLVF